MQGHALEMFQRKQSDSLKLRKLLPSSQRKHGISALMYGAILMVTISVILVTSQLVGNLQDHSERMEKLSKLAYGDGKEGADSSKRSMANINSHVDNVDPYTEVVWFPKTQKWFDKGHALMNVNSSDESITTFSSALKVGKQEAAAPLERKSIKDINGKEDVQQTDHFYKQAQYTREKQHDFLFARVYQCRAFCYFQIKQYRSGIADLTNSIASNPDNSLNRKNYYNRAQAYRLIGQNDRAQADLETSKTMPVPP
jgi:tetratricopeptide (TPR) repeat protein